MFKKLVSNLPFHPSLIDSVAFYMKRLKKEESLRRFGLILIGLVLLLQIYAVMFPAKPSLATSANDIVFGASDKEHIVNAYKNNRDSMGRNDIKAIYDHYGIGLEQITAAKPEKIGSKQRNFIATGRSASTANDTFVNILGASDGGIFQRPLSEWDKGNKESWYDSITGMSRFGFRFWIITGGCGNIIFEKQSFKPNLDINKKILWSKQIDGGSQIEYLIQFRNSGLDTTRKVQITDSLDNGVEYLSYTSNIKTKFSKDNNKLSWSIDNKESSLPPSQQWYTINLIIKVPSQKNKKICNYAYIKSHDVTSKRSSNPDNESCLEIKEQLCPNSNLPVPPTGIEGCNKTCSDGSVIPYTQNCPVIEDQTEEIICSNLLVIGRPSWSKRIFQIQALPENSKNIVRIDYFVNNKLVESKPYYNDRLNSLEYDFIKKGQYEMRAELIPKSAPKTQKNHCTIGVTITEPINDSPMISTDKTVSNITRGINNANNTTAYAGDKIKYTIHVYNYGNAAANNFELTGEYGESINDILEYSELIDKEDATYNDQTKFLSWEPVNIPAGGHIQKSFTIQIKNPIPRTPTSASDPLSFDFIMQNRYGQTVKIILDKPVTKVIEQSVTVLPNTGPSLSIFILAFIFSVVGYFFYRSRLLAKELLIINEEYRNGGI